MNPIAKSVYQFWFGADPLTPASVEKRQPLWWAGGADLDYDIERRFGKLVETASKGAFGDWLNEPKTNLALIILTDQFPRNLWRGTARALSCDALARDYAHHLVDSRDFVSLSPVERTFALMPFEHSESLADQEFCLSQFAQLKAETAEGWIGLVEGFEKFARAHCDIIRQFGRFPHRNRALGRQSTEAELEWLAEGGQRFGQ